MEIYLNIYLSRCMYTSVLGAARGLGLKYISFYMLVYLCIQVFLGQQRGLD